MPKVVIHREGGDSIEISDLTFEEVKELAGVNGHRHTVLLPRRRRIATAAIETEDNDVHGFLSNLSDRGRSFISALRNHPNGVEANDLAPLLKLNDPRQIGGFTGGGLAKIAKKYRIDMRDIYKSNVTFPEGKRRRMFYPGKFIKNGAL
ncbi:MAG: hypothetical protein WBQ09_06100 [Terriglobales bacterium]